MLPSGEEFLLCLCLMAILEFVILELDAAHSHIGGRMLSILSSKLEMKMMEVSWVNPRKWTGCVGSYAVGDR